MIGKEGSKHPSKLAKVDTSTLLVLVEGRNNDVIFHETKGRGQSGVRILEENDSEVTYKVRQDQRVIICSTGADNMIFVSAGLREAVDAELKGSGNRVKYLR